MVSLTLSIPIDLKKRMGEHPEIKWSEIVRCTITRQLDALEETDRLAANSRLTEGDVEELAEKAEKSMLKRWKEIKREARSGR